MHIWILKAHRVNRIQSYYLSLLILTQCHHLLIINEREFSLRLQDLSLQHIYADEALEKISQENTQVEYILRIAYLLQGLIGRSQQ